MTRTPLRHRVHNAAERLAFHMLTMMAGTLILINVAVFETAAAIHNGAEDDPHRH